MSNVTRRKKRTAFALAVLCGLPTAILAGGGPAVADSGEEDVKKVRVVREVGKVPGETNGEAVVVWVEEKVEGGELTEMHVSGSTSFTIDCTASATFRRTPQSPKSQACDGCSAATASARAPTGLVFPSISTSRTCSMPCHDETSKLRRGYMADRSFP